MPTYIVSIEDAPTGTYTKVRTILGDPKVWDYNKPHFTFEGDDDLLAAVLTVEGVSIVGADHGPAEKPEPAPAPAPAPEPAPEPAPAPKKVFLAFGTPAKPPTWSIQVDARLIQVRSHTTPSAAVYGPKLGGASCVVLDASGNEVDTWTA